MTDDGLVVVGDRFEEFLANGGTIPASAMLWRLRTDGLADGTPLVVGQGLSDHELARLEAGADGAEVPARVDKGLTHKRAGKNVMIGPARRTGDDQFAADLVIDARNEVLEDHLTGQHIPAIALMEAARQLWTVVTEEFLLDGPGDTRFVVVSVASRFHRYVFPLPTTLRLELLSRERGPAGEAFTTRTTFHQNGAVTAEVTSEYRVVPEKVSAKQEALAARQAVRTCLKS